MPWGYERLGVDDQVKVRQDNKMAKRALKGLEHAHVNGGFAGLEHPWGSYIWFTPEAEHIQSLPGWWMATWSQCCYGGKRVKWTSLLTNSRRAYEALNREECLCDIPLGVTPTGGYILTLTRKRSTRG